MNRDKILIIDPEEIWTHNLRKYDTLMNKLSQHYYALIGILLHFWRK